MMRSLLLTILSALLFVDVHAQELNCQVTVDYSQVGGTNTSVFETLKEAIS